MSSSTKGLKGNAKAGYREHIEGWTCDYARETGWCHSDLTVPLVTWGWVAWRGTSLLGEGVARTRRAARAAARAVVMERETRGLGKGPEQYYEPGDEGAGYTWNPELSLWVWAQGLFFELQEGTAPTLADARKAAREAT
jgi:hypothetical protein